jgi:hypothetical protein
MTETFNSEDGGDNQHPISNVYLAGDRHAYPVVYLPVILAKKHRMMPSVHNRKIRVKFIDTAAGILIKRDD